MMNSIINTIVILSLILFSATCIAQTNDKHWYAGVTAGVGNSSSDLNKKDRKYGLIGGIKLKEWLFLEAEATKHETYNNRYDDAYSTSYVDLAQQYQFAFLGLRATKFLSQSFGFTARLGAGYTTYKSNFERESMVNLSSAIGVVWRMRRFKDVWITHELQQIKYPIANSQSENEVSFNLSLRYRF